MLLKDCQQRGVFSFLKFKRIIISRFRYPFILHFHKVLHHIAIHFNYELQWACFILGNIK